MTSQVVFKVDSKIKAEAMKRAKSEGIPFASFLKMATKDFADGRYRVGIVDDEPFTAADKRAFERARKELKEGKTLSLDEFTRKLGFRSRH